MHVQHFKYFSMAVYRWTADSGLRFVDLIPYLVFESMSATVTSPNLSSLIAITKVIFGKHFIFLLINSYLF